MLTSAGEANPNYLKGVSCPFEKYYSLTQAVDNAVDREREENRTVIQLVTPRSVAYAAEELLSVTKVSQALNTFAGQRISKHSEDADYECSCETPRPRHAGVHPTVCQYCNLIIEDDFEAESWSGKCQRCGVKSNASTMSWFNTDLICMDCADKEKNHPKYQEAKDRENEEVQKGNLNYEGIGFDAEYQDYVYVGNDEECKLNGFYWSMMNNRDMNNWIIPEQEPTDFYNQFGQNVSNAETFNSDSWDDLYVVAENQMGGWEACDVTNGVLQTYSNQDDAEREAKMTIDDLNYDEDSWAGKRLSEVDIADNVEFIKYPNGQIAPYPPGRSANTGHHLEATRGIDTFTEPFEGEERSNWLLAAGIAGVFALGAWLLPKGD
jgi:hypothetical protein